MPTAPTRTALLAALATIVLLRVYMTRFEAEMSGGDPTPVLSLVRDVDPETLLTSELLGVRQLPQAYLDSRHIPAADRDRVLGIRLATAGRAGEALLWTDLVDMQRRRRHLSELVPTGMRGLAIQARGGSFDNLLSPGDRVDVLQASSGGARLLVENRLVLSVGGRTAPTAGQIRMGSASRITLALTPQEAAQLAREERNGPLRLGLRNPSDVLTQLDGSRPPEPTP